MDIKLTRSQGKALRKHFEIVEAAYCAGQKGMLVAQVHDGFGEPYIRVGFLDYKQSQPFLGAATLAFPRSPYAFAGIPSNARDTDNSTGNP